MIQLRERINARIVETGTGLLFINNDKELYLCINPAGFATLDDKKDGWKHLLNRYPKLSGRGVYSVSLDVAMARKDIPAYLILLK